MLLITVTKVKENVKGIRLLKSLSKNAITEKQESDLYLLSLQEIVVSNADRVAQLVISKIPWWLFSGF